MNRLHKSLKQHVGEEEAGTGTHQAAAGKSLTSNPDSFKRCSTPSIDIWNLVVKMHTCLHNSMRTYLWQFWPQILILAYKKKTGTVEFSHYIIFGWLNPKKMIPLIIKKLLTGLNILFSIVFNYGNITSLSTREHIPLSLQKQSTNDPKILRIFLS